MAKINVTAVSYLNTKPFLFGLISKNWDENLNIELDIPVGEWRYFTKEELKELNRLTASSDKTYDGDASDEGYD